MRHPKHQHDAGVCPFCLRDRLSHLSAATAGASTSSSSGSSSLCSSWEETVALSSAQVPRPRRGNLSLLRRQEGRKAAALAAGRRTKQEQHREKERTARRGSNF
uniref:Uncharacterized protein n=1 Tax=Setaria viridis TaxID=4556 RepID=A0A4U6SYR3_SETVI|nr:hypothetical protein SEVIR_9G276500v2 [Setaria viridis]